MPADPAVTTVCPGCRQAVSSTKSVPVLGGSALFKFNCETCAVAGRFVSNVGYETNEPGLFFRRTENL